jgi:hypothetical protein
VTDDLGLPMSAGRWSFADQRPALTGFIDLMTASMEAVMVQQHLARCFAASQPTTSSTGGAL